MMGTDEMHTAAKMTYEAACIEIGVTAPVARWGWLLQKAMEAALAANSRLPSEGEIYAEIVHGVALGSPQRWRRNDAVREMWPAVA